jgi:parvulin-like peptidyl-prolyl isomerase
LDKAIFTLPIGELSDVIKTPEGLHIVRVLDRTEATHKPFLEAQVEIREALQAEQRQKAFQEHLKKLRQEIPVEILDIPQPQRP